MLRHSIETPHEFNNHHLIYPRNQYRNRLERKFRSSVGLIIPTPVANHNQLHAELLHGIPKPTRQEMGDCMDLLDEVHPSMKVDRFWGAEAAMRFFVIMEAENESEGERYRDTRLHIATQIGILSRKSAGVDFPGPEEIYKYNQAS